MQRRLSTLPIKPGMAAVAGTSRTLLYEILVRIRDQLPETDPRRAVLQAGLSEVYARLIRLLTPKVQRLLDNTSMTVSVLEQEVGKAVCEVLRKEYSDLVDQENEV